MLDEVNFKMNHHPYYLYAESKNRDFVVRLFMPIDHQEELKLQSLTRRLNEICEPQAEVTDP